MARFSSVAFTLPFGVGSGFGILAGEERMREEVDARRGHRWVWPIIVAMALIEPVMHVWIPSCPPEGAVHSGLHTLDTYAYMTAFRYYDEGFFSPYAKCDGPAGDRDPSLYSLPHHHLYGVLGVVGKRLGVPLFLWLGLMNGLGLALMLTAAWHVFRVSVPRLAVTAFLLYALGGGLGGVAWVIASTAGLSAHAEFGTSFYRLFLYQLNEGASFQPWLLAARLYYTLPLAAAFGGLALTVVALQRSRYRGLVLAALLQGIAVFLNMRLGPVMLLGVLLQLALCEGDMRQRMGAAVLHVCATLTGLGAAYTMLGMNPELKGSVFASLGGVMWLVPFLYATVLLLPWVVRSVVVALHEMPWWARVPAGALAGYALAYGLLHLGYLAYYGNLLHGGDTSAALFASDRALGGAALGAGVAVLLGRSRRAEEAESLLGWWSLWFLVLFCAAVSALGGGWFMQFMPQRVMVGMGLPLAVLAAAGAHGLMPNWPRVTRVWIATAAGLGIVSVVVTWGFAYGPLGWHGIQKDFPWTRYAYITEADAALLDDAAAGVVLAPSLSDPLLGDVAVQRHGLRTVYGNGTMDFSRQHMPAVRARVNEFFSTGASDEARRVLVDDWCVTHVLCPDTDPVEAAVTAELRATPWLEEVSARVGGVLFEVRR